MIILTIQRYKKSFVFELPEDTNKFTPVYYPNTERVELRIGLYNIKPDYVVDEFGVIELKDEVLQLVSGV